MTARGSIFAVTGDAIDVVRDFNRAYTRRFGLLQRSLLGSDFSLAESRVLYELAHRDAPTASDIARDLDLDLGYLSRMLARLERQKQIERIRSDTDGRQSHIHLTRKGRGAFEALDRAARRQVAEMLAPLSAGQRADLLHAMRQVRGLLHPQEAADVRLRSLQVGDIGWITHRQALLYAQEYGWNAEYEALVAEILGAFVKNFQAGHENAWIAEREGTILGSVFLVRHSEEVAQLRLLYVEPSARGLGLGTRLVDQCIAYARSRKYRKVTLWTNDVLASARRIYQAAGFRLVTEERHHSFGKDLVGQTWELKL